MLLKPGLKTTRRKEEYLTNPRVQPAQPGGPGVLREHLGGQGSQGGVQGLAQPWHSCPDFPGGGGSSALVLGSCGESCAQGSGLSCLSGAQNSHQHWELCHGTVGNSGRHWDSGSGTVQGLPGESEHSQLHPTPKPRIPALASNRCPRETLWVPKSFTSRADPFISSCLRAGSQRSHLCLLCRAPI